MEGWISETWLLSKMKPMTKRKGELHGTGLIKRKFRHTDLSSLDDLARVVNESAACNLCQLVSTQDGTTIVPSQDWAGFLSSHFAAWMVSRSTITYALSVGPSRVVFLKKTATAEEETRCLPWGVWSPSLVDKLPLVPATGALSLERRRYLFERIREYCREESKDAVCPDPSLLIHQPPEIHPVPTTKSVCS